MESFANIKVLWGKQIAKTREIKKTLNCLKIQRPGPVRILLSNTRINQISRPQKASLRRIQANHQFSTRLTNSRKLNLNRRMTKTWNSNKTLLTSKTWTSRIYCSRTSFQSISMTSILSRRSMILFSFWDASSILRSNGRSRSFKSILINSIGLRGSDTPKEDIRQTRIRKSASRSYASATAEDQVTNGQIYSEREIISSASRSANREFQFARSKLDVTSGSSTELSCSTTIDLNLWNSFSLKRRRTSTWIKSCSSPSRTSKIQK